MLATKAQREYLAALIVESATADEASRLIRDLKRERAKTKDLLARITEAERSGDGVRLGGLLNELKSRTAHGQWLGLLEGLGISPRRAQRAMKAARRNGRARVCPKARPDPIRLSDPSFMGPGVIKWLRDAQRRGWRRWSARSSR